jgi:ubiquinone/menaquinone biosynthesis C-methylase UbiE
MIASQITEKASLSADKVQKMKLSFMNFYKEMDALMETQKGERPKKEMVEPIVKKRNDAIKKY